MTVPYSRCLTCRKNDRIARKERFDRLLESLSNRLLRVFRMIDDKTIATIERIEGRLKEIESVVNVLDQAIESYLHWMGENGYAKRTRK